MLNGLSPLFLLIPLYILAPAVLIVLCQRLQLLDKIGVVVLSFGLGIALALTGLIPEESAIKAVQEDISSVSVALALSLLVFSMDIPTALKTSGNTLKSLGLAFFSVILVSMVAAIFFAPHLPEIWQIAGMSVGAYTGGGPNMAAIKTAINGDTDIFTDMLTYDILLSAIFVVFIITLAKPIFSKFLLPFKEPELVHETNSFDHLADESANSYRSLANVKLIPKTLVALVLSALIVGISVGLSGLLSGSMAQAFTIIAITTLGVCASFVPFIRALPNSYPLGMYLILIFCLTTGSMVDITVFTELKVTLFAYIGTILIGSLILQAILCRMFKIDVDTFLITASAAVMSVPFIPVIAGALKNRYVLVPGFAAAIIGYILGNYLGIMVAWSVKALV